MIKSYKNIPTILHTKDFYYDKTMYIALNYTFMCLNQKTDNTDDVE